jgi:transcriptional regulator GlxA family with amidase domain
LGGIYAIITGCLCQKAAGVYLQYETNLLFNTGGYPGAIAIFQQANDHFRKRGGDPFYELQLAGLDSHQQFLNAQLTIKPILDIGTVAKPDLIIIPAMLPDGDLSSNNNRQLLNWLVWQYKEGAEIASLCVGGFFLAATGLLDGKECSTHWQSESDFLSLYPRAILRTDKIMTDSNGIYTAGGALSSLNLILYFIEKFSGRELAVYCSKILQIDINRDSQAPFILFQGQKSHADEEIRKVQEHIEKNIEAKLSVEGLANTFNISKRSFIRRFKKATNNSPIDYRSRYNKDHY